MRLNFCVDATFQMGVEQLASYLNYEQSEAGVPVYAVCGDRIGASLKDGIGTIYYKNKHHFFREMGVFIENARKSEPFVSIEDLQIRAKLTKAVVDILRRNGVLDGIDETDQMSLFSFL